MHDGLICLHSNQSHPTSTVSRLLHPRPNNTQQPTPTSPSDNGFHPGSKAGQEDEVSVPVRRNQVDCQTDSNPSSRYNLLDEITVHVGPDEIELHVPRNLICSRSAFFRAACAEMWTGNNDNIIRLPEDSAEMFSIYLQTLHANEVVADPDKSCTRFCWPRLVKTYVFAHKVGDAKSANVVMDEMLRILKTQSSPVVILQVMRDMSYTYEHTTSSSPLRGVPVGYIAHKAGCASFRTAARRSDAPSAFLVEVVGTLKETHKPSDWFSKQPNETWHIAEDQAE